MLPNDDADVLILGGGAAGLAAAHVLVDAHLNVLVLEARDRVGGRIWTIHDQATAMPIELGAEFVHGKPPATVEIVEAAGLLLFELSGDRWCSDQGRMSLCQDFYEELEQVFKKMPTDGDDLSFLDFLDRKAKHLREEKRRHALRYIEGFEAAKPERISVHALVRENKKSDEIDGDRPFRIISGYDSLLNAMMADINADQCRIHLNTVAKAVRWSPGSVTIESDEQSFRAPRAVVTLPLSVLQSESVRFSPQLFSKQSALAQLEMGHVLRVTLRFRERFWGHLDVEKKSLRNLSFLLSDRAVFPTWWSTMPKEVPLLTGWCAGPHAETLSLKGDEDIVNSATESIAVLLGVTHKELKEQMVAAYFHNWQADPFSRGAYSYACVGGANAARQLAQPIGGTLYFAGEAANFEGRNGTVDGAIESGKRAARELLEAAHR